MTETRTTLPVEYRSVKADYQQLLNLLKQEYRQVKSLKTLLPEPLQRPLLAKVSNNLEANHQSFQDDCYRTLLCHYQPDQARQIINDLEQELADKLGWIITEDQGADYD